MIAVAQKTVDTAADFMAIAEAAGHKNSKWGEFAIAEIPEVKGSRHAAGAITPPLTCGEVGGLIARIEEFSGKAAKAYCDQRSALGLRCKAYLVLLQDHLRVSDERI